MRTKADAACGEASQFQNATIDMARTDWVKLARFARIYGPRRALVKALGRLRIGRRLTWPAKRSRPGIAVIGCGQFGFSTIAHFAGERARIVSCYDTDASSAVTLSRMYGARAVSTVATEMFSDPEIDCVYIASNHASHSDYAIAALAAGKRVYIEKPVVVSHEQLANLVAAERALGGQVFAGYNRPFSGAIRELHACLVKPIGPLTLSCFVSGHRLPPNIGIAVRKKVRGFAEMSGTGWIWQCTCCPGDTCRIAGRYPWPGATPQRGMMI
ncbi:MAG: Gfo/Idh/MocA family oxidoreductase [Burkholderiaceae bacterium]|nr:Gfo/Idh/MocA family oxidoreductase [Burkholderiaceae bacterium]